MVLKAVYTYTNTPENIGNDYVSQKNQYERTTNVFERLTLHGHVHCEFGTRNQGSGNSKYCMFTIKKYHDERGKNNVGTQCIKCQRFGHTASNCGLEYRCVNCPNLFIKKRSQY